MDCLGHCHCDFDRERYTVYILRAFSTRMSDASIFPQKCSYCVQDIVYSMHRICHPKLLICHYWDCISSPSVGVPICDVRAITGKRTVGFSVHHDGGSAVSVGARGSDNILEGSSNSRGSGSEGTSLGGESRGRSQKGRKTKESHCIVYCGTYNIKLFCGKISISASGERVRGQGTPLDKERALAKNLKRANEIAHEWQQEDRHRFKLGRN